LSIPYDADFDLLVSRLAGPLPLAMREAFRQAAAAAAAGVSCPGEGSLYRALVPVQRAFFDPPDDCRAGWDIGFERPRASKLIAARPLEYGGDQRHVRYRRLKVVG
jgi:hypothetical protein